jgi:hypothetical protein
MELLEKECDTARCKEIAKDLREPLRKINAPMGEIAQVIIFDPARQGGPFVSVERRKDGKEHKCAPFEILFPVKMTPEEIVERVKECLDKHSVWDVIGLAR